MTKIRAPFLYTETRLNLDQGHAGSTVDITLPQSNNSQSSIFTHSLPAKRSVVTDIQIGSDESTFAREHLATDGSVYFRRDGRYPRSFLWRLLDDRKALEIQSVDLSEDQSEKTEALLTLILRFPAAIRPFCIGFGDPDEKDALNVFAITTTNELWTLTLQKDFFVHLRTTEALTMEWCKVSKPTLFIPSNSKPYRMFVSNSRDIFVSLEDGSFVRFTRNAGDDGSNWHESKYSEGHWTMSLSRTIPWRSRKLPEFGDLALDPTAVACAASIDDAHLVTVCLNNMLRIWDLQSGKILAEVDILGQRKESQETRYLTTPSQRQLLQVLEMPGRSDQYYVVTYSPKEQRFRFWEVQNACEGSEDVRAMRAGINFTPPIDKLMDTAVWNLEEFYLSQGNAQSELWIRVRSGPASQVFTVKFNPFDFDDKSHDTDAKNRAAQASWQKDWISVAHGQQTVEALDAVMPRNATQESSDMEIVNIPDQWLDALFLPGRFSVPTLETALEVYSKARNYVSSSRANKAPLKDRLTKAIKASSGDKPKKVAEQWQIFYDLVRDLHKRRSDAISFAVDPCDRLPWVVSSDFIAPIRACNNLELCEYNRDIANDVQDPTLVLWPDIDLDINDQRYDPKTEIGPLLHVAHTYRTSLPASVQDALHRAVLAEMLEESDLSVMDRLHALQGQIGLASLPPDDLDDIEALVNDNGGYAMFQSRNFELVVKATQEEIAGRHTQEQITRFGTRTMIRSAQEMIAINTNALLDLLAMVLVLEGNYEPEDLANAIQDAPAGDDDLMELDNDPDIEFQPARLFMRLAKALREYAVLNFMTSNMRQEQRRRHRRSTADGPAVHMMSGSTVHTEPSYSLTLLESMFIGDWPNITALDEMPTQKLITYMCGAWLTKLNIDQYDNFSAYVLADLIKHGDLRLATEFLPYVPKTGWSTYLRGRLSIATGNGDDAAHRFREVAFSMGLGFFDVNDADRAELLRPDEHNYFQDGLAPFYDHVMTLFNSIKAFTHVVDFANLALQALGQQRPKPKGVGTEPDKKELDAHNKRTSDITNRLFSASLETADFQQAYTALTRLPSATRHFSLNRFIESLIAHNRISLLLSFPWTTLAQEADEALVNLVKKKVVSVGQKPEYHKILFAWRVGRGDWRGAGQVAFDRLALLKASGETTRNPGDERLVEAYLLLINTLACVSPEEAWVIREPQVVNRELDGRRTNGYSEKVGGDKGSKRCIVSIEDIRREYQAELDRLAQLEQGDFAFAGDESGESLSMDIL